MNWIFCTLKSLATFPGQMHDMSARCKQCMVERNKTAGEILKWKSEQLTADVRGLSMLGEKYCGLVALGQVGEVNQLQYGSVQA